MKKTYLKPRKEDFNNNLKEWTTLKLVLTEAQKGELIAWLESNKVEYKL